MANKTTNARTEYSSAATQIAHERNLEPEVVADIIKQAFIAAFKKDHPDQYNEEGTYDVDLDSQTGEAKIFEVVDGKRVNVTPPGFGRIATQTAKQVILQKIREAEKESIVADFEKRLGSLASGTVLRHIGPEVIIEIEVSKQKRTEAVLPISEQVHSENYRINQKMNFYLDSIRDSVRGKEIVVSRANNEFIKELFKREVPEVNSNAVEIKAIARDPGSRTKIAVYSHQAGVDPVGSCVGQKGVRVQAIISELNGEKIDIVQFSEDPEKFVAAALSPASGLSVKINEKDKTAEVMAPSDQLSLAIGREGQNAKLGGKLTGYHIDIKADPATIMAQPEEQGTSEKKEDTVSDTDQTISNEETSNEAN
jgi:transcription termination/antitermination protein NusA